MSFRSKYSLKESKEILSNNIDKTDVSLLGEINGNKFKIHKRKQYRNPGMPYLYGHFRETCDETLIDCSFDFPKTGFCMLILAYIFSVSFSLIIFFFCLINILRGKDSILDFIIISTILTIFIALSIVVMFAKKTKSKEVLYFKDFFINKFDALEIPCNDIPKSISLYGKFELFFKKIFKYFLIFLGILFLVFISLLANLIFVPQFSDEEMFAYYFDIDKNHIEDLKVDRWSSFMDYGRDFYFKIKSKYVLEKYIEKYFMPADKNSSRYKSSLEYFTKKTSVRWWKPDLNSDYEFYDQNSSYFKNQLTPRNLFYDKTKNVIYASFMHFSDPEPIPPSSTKYK